MPGSLNHGAERALAQFDDTLANEATPSLIVVVDVLPATDGAEGGGREPKADCGAWLWTICLRAGRFPSQAHATNGTKAAHTATRPNAIPTAVR